MARESTPSSPNSRFRVWNALGDLYSHTELAENWDTLDAIIGRPADNSVWPPQDERGIDGGIYGYLKALEASGDGVGATKLMWWPEAAGEIADFIPDKWVAMTGQVITAANHDFPTNEDIHLPDTRNMFLMGADPLKAAGVAGEASNSHSAAPGVTQNVGGSNVGGGGTNVASHAHSVPTHVHAIPNHSHSIAAHAHDMDHRHEMQESSLSTGTPAHAIHAFHLKSTAIHRRWNLNGHNLGALGYNPDIWPDQTVTPHGGAGGSAAIVPHIQHTHFPRFWAGTPRVPNYPSSGATRTTTGSTSLSTSTASGLTTGSSSAADTGSATLDNRPAHVAFVVLLKVRN